MKILSFIALFAFISAISCNFIESKDQNEFLALYLKNRCFVPCEIYHACLRMSGENSSNCQQPYGCDCKITKNNQDEEYMETEQSRVDDDEVLGLSQRFRADDLLETEQSRVDDDETFGLSRRFRAYATEQSRVDDDLFEAEQSKVDDDEILNRFIADDLLETEQSRVDDDLGLQRFIADDLFETEQSRVDDDLFETEQSRVDDDLLETEQSKVDDDEVLKLIYRFGDAYPTKQYKTNEILNRYITDEDAGIYYHGQYIDYEPKYLKKSPPKPTPKPKPFPQFRVSEVKAVENNLLTNIRKASIDDDERIGFQEVVDFIRNFKRDDDDE